MPKKMFFVNAENGFLFCYGSDVEGAKKDQFYYGELLLLGIVCLWSNG